MDRIRAAALLTVVLIGAPGCDDSTTDLGGPGRFTAEVSGGLAGSFEGTATFGAVTGTESGSAFVVSLLSDEETPDGRPARIIAFVHEQGSRPDTGAVSLLDAPAWADTATAAFPDSLYAIFVDLGEEGEPLYRSAGGVLEVSTSSGAVLTGAFTFDAVLSAGGTSAAPVRVTVTGELEAVPGEPRVSF